MFFLGMVCLALVIPTTASAATLFLNNCPSCQGASFSLSYLFESATAGNDTYDVVLTVDTSAYNGGGRYIEAVAPKLSNSVVSATLISAPGTLAFWSTQNGGLDAGGCNGAGSGFFCSNTTLLQAPVSNSPNTWEWMVVAPTGQVNGIASLKSLFTDSQGNKIGALVSDDPTFAVSEPRTLALALLGLSCIVFARYRRRTLQQ